jgi:conjugative transfer region protein TrbK
METKTLARITAVAFIGVAMTLAALQTQHVPTAPTETLTLPLEDNEADELLTELRRCQALGASGANDARCLHAWAENRSRFFMSKRRSAAQLGDDATTIVPLTNGSVETPGSDDLAGDLGPPPTFERNR